MTTEPRRLVRPAFRKLAIAAFVMLVPLVCLAAWDYVEARRLNQAIAAIRAAGQPVTLREGARSSNARTVPAERYFLAAAEIARVPSLERRDGLLDATHVEDWSDDLVARMRRYIEDRREAFVLLDLAASMPPDAVRRGGPATSSVPLFDLARLAGFRTTLAIHDADGAAAIHSIESELRLWRAIADTVAPYARLSTLAVIERFGATVNRTHPAAADLARLAPALDGVDLDDRLKASFVAQRAGFLDQAMSPQWVYDWAINGVPALWQLAVFEPVRRPFAERFVANRVERLTEIIGYMDQPWPERANAVTAAYAQKKDDKFVRGWQNVDRALANRIMIDVALVRCARIVLGIESFRSDHGKTAPDRLDDLVPKYLQALPMDPYSGGHLLIHHEATSYAVYSVGSNGRDEGGDFGSSRFVDGTPEPRDLGLRVQLR